MGPNRDQLSVEARYNGPPGSGNGGWTCGLIAVFVPDGVPEVMLRKPPPLDTVLRVGDGQVTDPHGTVIATFTRRETDISPVPGISLATAEEASLHYAGHGKHHFPTCFVCGPVRSDGLRVFPGRLSDGRTGGVFTVPVEVSEPMIWAALDCPGGWTVIEGDHPWVLGRMATILEELPKPGDRCVVVGQVISRTGRKALVRTSLYHPGGDLLARSEATWIAVGV